MKPKTKKTLIWIAAAVIVAVIVWLVFRKKSAEYYINHLDTTADNKELIKGYLAHAAATQDINANAAANGLNYNQALALSAVYYLVGNTIDEATWAQWVAQVKTM